MISYNETNHRGGELNCSTPFELCILGTPPPIAVQLLPYNKGLEAENIVDPMWQSLNISFQFIILRFY